MRSHGAHCVHSGSPETVSAETKHGAAYLHPSDRPLLRSASRAQPVVVVFQRPALPLPVQGWVRARKALRRKENHKFTQVQVAWLTKLFMSGANGGERIRDKEASKLMKKEFAKQLGADGRTLWLKQSQIRGWFSRKVAGLKRAALDRALAELAEAEEAGEGGGE